MMHSESKEIYGVNVFSSVAMLHQLRRWRAICELRSFWNADRYFLVLCRKFKHLNCHADDFNIQQCYEFIREFTKEYQQRGAI